MEQDFRHNGAMYQRFLGTTKDSRDAVFPIKIEQLANHPYQEKHEKEEPDHREA